MVAALAGAILGFWVSLIPEDFVAYLSSFLPADRSLVAHKRVHVEFAPPPVPTFDPPASPREVYPYSLIPGGVRSVKELRDVFDHDPVLAAHYRGFDFKRARIIRLTQDRTVYVSYRIGGRIYWTTKLIPVHAGEILITDGVMTIRTRCGNQVSVSPRQEVSPKQEPNVALLERPMRFYDPPSVVPPAPNLFESSLQRPTFPTYVGPAPSLPLLRGPAIGLIFAPNPDVCGGGLPPKRKPVYGGPTPGGGPKKHKHNGNPCGGGVPGQAPEPSSLILLATGMGGMCLRYGRRRAAPVAPASD